MNVFRRNFVSRGSSVGVWAVVILIAASLSLFYFASETRQDAQRLEAQLPAVNQQLEVECSKLSELFEKIDVKRFEVESVRSDSKNEFLNIQFIDTTAEEMYLEAKRLESEGRKREALEAYLACISLGGLGNQQINREGSLRWDVWPSQFRRRVNELSVQYPEFGDALLARREHIESRFLEGDVFFVQFDEWKQLLEMLGQEERLLGFFDAIPKEEQSPYLAQLLFDEFLAARRYEAAHFGKEYHLIRGDFERGVMMNGRKSGTKLTEEQEKRRARQLRKTIEEAAKGLEVLAGVGEKEQAIRLAKRMLEIDDSEETVELVRKHFKRAGQSRLFGYIGNPEGGEG